MKVKIAVFGRQNTIDRINTLSTEFKDVEILSFVYTNVEQTVELIERVFKCDVYLFTEGLAYLYVKDIIEKKRLPAVQVDFDAYTIAAAFYQLQTNWKKTPERIGIDVVEDKYINGVIHDLKLDSNSIHPFIHDMLGEPQFSQLLEFYDKLWKEKKIDHVLTATDEIRLELLDREIPASTITIPDFNLIQAVEEAISLAKLNQSQNKQIVTGVIKVSGIDDSTNVDRTYTTDLLKKLKRILTTFANKTDTTMIHSHDNSFILLGTDKLHEHLKGHYREFPLLQEMKQKLKLPVHLGFGLGLHAKESAENASIAIDNCSKSNQSICYIVNERQETIGPIGIKREIDTSSLYHALIHKAKLNNELSYNFIDFIRERNNEPFSSHDVALFYQVTKRSAERTVNKLLSGEVIKVSGEERPYTKGRPRKLFTLNQ